MSVISARVGQPAPFATSTSARASARASSRLAMKAPEPDFTSRISASSPAASFFDRIEAVMRSIELHRAGDVADAVEAAVRRGDVGGLADDGAAGLATTRAKVSASGWVA